MKKIIIALAAVIAVCAALCACSGLESSSSGGKSGKALSEIWSDIKDEVEFKDFSEFQDIKRLNRSYGITEDMFADIWDKARTVRTGRITILDDITPDRVQLNEIYSRMVEGK